MTPFESQRPNASLLSTEEVNRDRPRTGDFPKVSLTTAVPTEHGGVAARPPAGTRLHTRYARWIRP